MYRLYERYNFEVIHLFDILFETNNMNQILSLKAKEIIKSYIALNYSTIQMRNPQRVYEEFECSGNYSKTKCIRNGSI